MKRENEKLQIQVNNVNARILKFSSGQKSLNFLFGKQIQTLGKREIEFEQNNEIVLLEPNILGRKLLHAQIEYLPILVLYEDENNHLPI